MKRPEAEISVIRSGGELLKAWSEYGFEAPGGNQAWAEAVETPNHDILIAHLGEIAVGFVDIKFSGPISREPEFAEALRTAFPGDIPTPTLYMLNVHPYFRRLKIGRKLMESAEQRIINTKDAPARAALNVRTNNEPAVSLYKSMDYKTLQYNGKKEVKIDFPELNEAGEWIQSTDKVFFMTKDLS